MEKYKFYIYITFYFIIAYAVVGLLGALVVYFTYIQSAKTNLQSTIARVKEDVKYSNGQWDTFYYNSDPTLPGSDPLYILTTDGYIIDRWRPINGLLYTTDLDYLLRFDSPQTVNLNPYEFWRVFTLPIVNNNKTLGAVTVSIYNPRESNLEEIDAKLRTEANNVLSQIKIVNEEIDTTDVDIRRTSFDTAVRVIDKYNTLLAKSNNSNSIDRTPSYIDRSYVAEELNNPGFRHVRDSQTKIPYLVLTSPYTANGETVGVVLAGYSLANVFQQLQNYVISLSIALIPMSLCAWLAIRRYIIAPRQLLDLRYMEFSKRENKVTINDTSIEIPELTNQYALCEAVFSKPQKKWTAEELVDRFEDTNGNAWRKVYDSMVLLNKKVEPVLKAKLVIVKDAEFFLNPKLIPYIKK